MTRREKPAPSTISDKDWRSIQDRARKANAERARIGSEDGKRGAQRGAANYRNRHQN